MSAPSPSTGRTLRRRRWSLRSRLLLAAAAALTGAVVIEGAWLVTRGLRLHDYFETNSRRQVHPAAPPVKPLRRGVRLERPRRLG